MDKHKKATKAVYRRRRFLLVTALLLIAVSAASLPSLIKSVNESAPEQTVMEFEDPGVEAMSRTEEPAQASGAQTPGEHTPEAIGATAPAALSGAGKSPEQNVVKTQAAASPSAKSSTPTPKPKASPSPSVSKSPSQTKSPSESPNAQGNEDLPYYLYVEKGSFTLTIYKKDADGEYTKVYKTYRLAHGGNKTPAGKFTLGARERWHEFPDGGFVQYAVRYHARLYLHSPLYGKEDAKVLWPSYYDGDHGIGKESTGGCLRMVTEASRFIYENCPEGTVLEIVNGSPKETTSDPVPSRNGKRVDPTDVNVN